MNHHFSELTMIVMKTLHVNRRELADLLGVRYETVCRWVNEECTPNYRGRLLYLEQLKRLIKEGGG